MNRFLNKIIYPFVAILLVNVSCNAELLRDEFVESDLKSKKLEKPFVNSTYNYESYEKIPIKLNITKKISTSKEGVPDGQPLKFYVKEDVKHDGKVVIPKRTEVTANIATSIDRGMNGIPATIIVDNFKIKGIDDSKIKGVLIKRGLNLSILVFPIKWALTPIPGAGSLTNLIIGGDAHINPKKVVTIYYYPHWGEKI